MAGSYKHLVGADGEFTMDLIENMGDAHEALEDCFGIIRRAALDEPAPEPKQLQDRSICAEVGRIAYEIGHTDTVEGCYGDAEETVAEIMADVVLDQVPAPQSKLHYSGPASRAFWKAVDALGNGTEWDEAYAAGVELQNMEERVLKMLSPAPAAIEPLPLSEWELVQERAHTLGFGENDPIASETTNACYDFAAREMHAMSEVLRLRAQRGSK